MHLLVVFQGLTSVMPARYAPVLGSALELLFVVARKDVAFQALASLEAVLMLTSN